jgi:hypothetical protein
MTVDELIFFVVFGGGAARMQVEVSKYTEGAKEKARRPNGLPESLIRYDGTTLLQLDCKFHVRIVDLVEASARILGLNGTHCTKSSLSLQMIVMFMGME